MLKHKADYKTLLFLSITTALLFIQWNTGFNWIVYLISIYFATTVAVIAHNHNHVPMWKNSTLNSITDYWITLFYGFPVFAWTPTHNKNHHKFNNRAGDYTITYRFSEANNIFTLASYPSISGYYQHNPISSHLKYLWKEKRGKFFFSVLQYVALGLFIIAALYINWRKALIFVVIPQQFALVSVLVFNYIQHVHADEESSFNHSRNFVSKYTNFMMFNNGLHTAHHHRASIHWSKLPEAHAKLKDQIAPHLNEQFIWGFLIKSYLLAPFSKTFRTTSMRVQRKEMEKNKEAIPASSIH
jgi:beta-carotene hydroxylase